MNMHIEGKDDDWDPQPQKVASGRNGPALGLIAFAVVAVLTVVFVLQNGNRATLSFLWFEGESRVWFVILVSIVIGAALDRLFGLWWRRRRRRRKESDGS